MRALAIVHKYPPIHNAGAEWMLHAIARDWVDRGDDVFVVFPGAPAYELDGVIVGRTPARGLERLCREVDVVVTHLDNTGAATRAARIAGKPIVHLLHNDRQLQYHNVKPGPDTLLVANSQWIRDTIPKGFHAVVTCRPPVRVADYETERAGDAITLVNRTEAKGVRTLFAVADSMPDRRFLAVAGAYGVQSRVPTRLRNVESRPQTPAIRDDVYRETAVLLMPSSYESWGRVAIEAACSGIPTIAHPTVGLTEALGDAGIFVDRRRTREWVARLRELEAPDAYAEASDRARARALELEALVSGDLAELYDAVTAVSGGPLYASRVTPILDSMTTKGKCPVCQAEKCTCGPADVLGRATGGVEFVDPVRPGGPATTYRTWRGDFRYTSAGAIRAGLIPEPESATLAAMVRRRFNDVGADVGALERAYAAASEPARAAFLETVALTPPMALRVQAAELIATLGSSSGAGGKAPAPPTAAADDPPDGRVGDVLDWAGTDPDRLARALEAERGGKARPTLIAELEHRIGA